MVTFKVIKKILNKFFVLTLKIKNNILRYVNSKQYRLLGYLIKLFEVL